MIHIDYAAGRSEYVSALSMGDVGLWPALNDALLMFPLTKGLRLALLNLLCSQQVPCQNCCAMKACVSRTCCDV